MAPQRCACAAHRAQGASAVRRDGAGDHGRALLMREPAMCNLFCCSQLRFSSDLEFKAALPAPKLPGTAPKPTGLQAGRAASERAAAGRGSARLYAWAGASTVVAGTSLSPLWAHRYLWSWVGLVCDALLELPWRGRASWPRWTARRR